MQSWVCGCGFVPNVLGKAEVGCPWVMLLRGSRFLTEVPW